MSKTTEIQIEKSRNLIEGLRRHVREMGERGVSNNEINEMEKTVAMLSEANAEVDRLREELTPKVKKMNDLMVLVKALLSTGTLARLRHSRQTIKCDKNHL